jgi:hypothetical protein
MYADSRGHLLSRITNQQLWRENLKSLRISWGFGTAAF